MPSTPESLPAATSANAATALSNLQNFQTYYTKCRAATSRAKVERWLSQIPRSVELGLDGEEFFLPTLPTYPDLSPYKPYSNESEGSSNGSSKTTVRFEMALHRFTREKMKESDRKSEGKGSRRSPSPYPMWRSAMFLESDSGSEEYEENSSDEESESEEGRTPSFHASCDYTSVFSSTDPSEEESEEDVDEQSDGSDWETLPSSSSGTSYHTAPPCAMLVEREEEEDSVTSKEVLYNLEREYSCLPPPETKQRSVVKAGITLGVAVALLAVTSRRG